MPLLYTHLIPATFDGRARMNVANALAAAAAAWAAGAHLHDIRQGLRTFTHVVLPGARPPQRGASRRLQGRSSTTATTSTACAGWPSSCGAWSSRPDEGGGPAHRGRAIGVIGIPGDRRDEDQREYGDLAADAFDEIIVREDNNLRGRKPGESAELVIRGVRNAPSEGQRDHHEGRKDPRRDRGGPDRDPPLGAR